jgi:large subunit ribosomal protein L31
LGFGNQNQPHRSFSDTPDRKDLSTMKDGIHPEYQETKVSCGCGNKFVTRSTRPEMRIDICNQCHPFFTGKLKYIDTAGRIEKFQNKFAAGSYASLQEKKKKKKVPKPSES